MDGESVNFLALPVIALVALVGAPWAFRKAGYPASKTVFGTLALVMAGLAIAGMLTSIQRKAGVPGLPLAWGVLAGLAWALHRISGSRAP